MLRTIQRLLCVASFAFVTMGSVAHASFILCTGDGQTDGSFESWRAVCAGDEAAYADVQVVPHVWGDQMVVHVTDHLDCPGEMRLQCGLSTSLEQNYECIEESGPFSIEADGALSWVFVWCGCYSPDEDCHN